SSRRRHTRWPRDWSSDVCSSDLSPALLRARGGASFRDRRVWHSAEDVQFAAIVAERKVAGLARVPREGSRPGALANAVNGGRTQIGRASCRERGEVSV